MRIRANALLERAGSLALTYSQVGATASQAPPGYRFFRRRERVSDHAADFDRAVTALRGWQMHRGAGLTVLADGDARLGSHVVVGFGPAPFTLLAPCRVVDDIDGDKHSGFAYGTLQGHPESGEERFVVERTAEGVFFEVTAFSKPATPLARLGGPLTRLVQDRVTTRYLRSLRRALAEPPGR
ncbi:DUF1990 family protein [Cryptosporangium phraense]|uniref:DUF1990 domain-containing protein n=1 Tax=Cryptosporangium phraense TaxID=2593070 RepID=A0A545AZW4_9ACTN|nr:DUF1990 domain-containing protein [Cryptosporangium phraense]TQS46867.1 DUF1990 domain-containing protein [Cryptosporangium phraense]